MSSMTTNDPSTTIEDGSPSLVGPSSNVSFEGLSDFSKLIEVLRTKFMPPSSEWTSQDGSSQARVRCISCCLNVDSVRQGFDKYLSNPAFVKRRQEAAKSESVAKSFRTKGNKYFKGRKYDEALEAFSSAVVSAPFPPTIEGKQSSDGRDHGSRELALAFANRSATLFHLKQFKEALHDASLAIAYDYPVNQRHTLLLRQSLCLKALGRPEEADKYLQLTLDAIDEDGLTSSSAEDSPTEQTVENGGSGDANPTKKEDFKTFVKSTFDKFSGLPSSTTTDDDHGLPKHVKEVEKRGSKLRNASDWVKLVVDDKHGRHLKTSRSVNRDEVVLAEKPFAAALNYQYFDSFCHHCCQELGGRLYPCRDCSAVRFCSKNCQEESWSSYHSVECPYIPILLSMGVLRLSLRILIVAGIQTCLAVHEEASKVDRIVDKVSGGSDYKSVYGLKDHSKDLSPLVSSRQSLAAAFMLFLASNRMNLISESDPNYLEVGGLLLKHIHQISINSMVMFHQPIISGPHDINGIDVKSQVIGTALYPTLALMNHSCLPNTELFFVGSHLFVKTRCPIAQSTEVTVSYGPLFKKMPRNDRMDTLQSQYYFTCECPACSDAVLTEDQLSRPEDHPILTECYICPSCSGPLLINTVNISSSSTEEPPVTICEGKCLKCGQVTGEVNQLVDRIDSAKKVANLCKALTQFGRRADAHKSYVKQLNSLTKICYPTNRFLLSIMSDVLSLSLSLEKIEEARKLCEDMTQVKKATFGPSSYEYRQGLLQLLNIRWSQQKKIDDLQSQANSRTSSMNKKIVQRLVTESNEAVAQAMSLVDRNKIDGDLLVLDSSLVSFLKELVDLERHLK